MPSKALESSLQSVTREYTGMSSGLFYLNIVLVCVKVEMDLKTEGMRHRDERILGVPDAIPQDLLDKAECVVVFPSVKSSRLASVAVMDGAQWCASPERITLDPGELQPCMLWMAAISDFSSVGRQPARALT